MSFLSVNKSVYEKQQEPHEQLTSQKVSKVLSVQKVFVDQKDVEEQRKEECPKESL